MNMATLKLRTSNRADNFAHRRAAKKDQLYRPRHVLSQIKQPIHNDI